MDRIIPSTRVEHPSLLASLGYPPPSLVLEGPKRLPQSQGAREELQHASRKANEEGEKARAGAIGPHERQSREQCCTYTLVQVESLSPANMRRFHRGGDREVARRLIGERK